MPCPLPWFTCLNDIRSSTRPGSFEDAWQLGERLDKHPSVAAPGDAPPAGALALVPSARSEVASGKVVDVGGVAARVVARESSEDILVGHPTEIEVRADLGREPRNLLSMRLRLGTDGIVEDVVQREPGALARALPCGQTERVLEELRGIHPARVLLRNDSAIAIRDAYPVSPGHTLVIPVRHLASFFDTAPEERTAMLGLLEAAKQQLHLELGPAGYDPIRAGHSMGDPREGRLLDGPRLK